MLYGNPPVYGGGRGQQTPCEKLEGLLQMPLYHAVLLGLRNEKIDGMRDEAQNFKTRTDSGRVRKSLRFAPHKLLCCSLHGKPRTVSPFNRSNSFRKCLDFFGFHHSLPPRLCTLVLCDLVTYRGRLANGDQAVRCVDVNRFSGFLSLRAPDPGRRCSSFGNVLFYIQH